MRWHVRQMMCWRWSIFEGIHSFEGGQERRSVLTRSDELFMGLLFLESATFQSLNVGPHALLTVLSGSFSCFTLCLKLLVSHDDVTHALNLMGLVFDECSCIQE